MGMPHHPHLLLTNTRALTLDHRHPVAEAVAVQGGRIMAVGKSPQVSRLKGPGTRVIDCQGLTLLPGFNDAHCHVLALARSLTGIDCRPEKISSIAELKQAILKEAQRTPHGQWIRGFGYDDLSLAERRYPDRWDLDEVARQHPVRLDHRSGHAIVLNSLGLELAGVRRETVDPVDGIIERDSATGEPTGVLLEMSGFLRDRLGTTRDQAEFDVGIARANRLLLQYGITSVQDAGPSNDLARWSTFQGLLGSERFQPRITMMVGAVNVDQFAAAGMSFGTGNDRLRLGHAKIMLTLTTGSLQPEVAELRQLVAEAHHSGFPVAIHAVESEAVAAAARVLWEDALGQRQPPWSRLAPDRIEHCSECPPELIAQCKKSAAMVVTQPGFIYWNGDRYLERVDPGMLPYLYSISAFASAGVPLGFSSDAPVIDPNPWLAIYAAVTRGTREGNHLPEEEARRQEQRIDALDALRRYTTCGASAEGVAAEKGTITVGKLADLVLVNADPTRVQSAELKNVKAVLTIAGGKVVWESGW